jgi:hypothetical protein
MVGSNNGAFAKQGESRCKRANFEETGEILMLKSRNVFKSKTERKRVLSERG